MANRPAANPDVLKDYCVCLKPNNLNDPKYFWRCVLAFIPFPGWCILHSQIFAQMNITKYRIERPLPEELGNYLCRPGIAGIWSCCFGLAHNRNYLRRHKKLSQQYYLDAFGYLFCGFFLITNDLEIAFKGEPRAGDPEGKDFKNT